MTVAGGTDCAKVVLLDADFADTATEYDFEFYEPHTETVLLPGAVDERYEPEGETYRCIENKLRRIDAGFRYRMVVSFTGVNVAGHQTLTAIRNHAAASLAFKCYPHKDEDNWFICLLLPEEAVTEKRIIGDVGYRDLVLVFEAIETIDYIPSGIDFIAFWCDVDEGGYDADEISYWCDVDEESYTSADNITYWTPTGAYHTEVDGTAVQFAQLSFT